METVPVIFANIISTGIFTAFISKVPQSKETLGVILLIINLIIVGIMTIVLGIYSQVAFLTILLILGISLVVAFLITLIAYYYYVHYDLDEQ